MLFKGTQNFLSQLAPFGTFLESKIPLFARKKLLVFLMSIWPKSAKHQMPSMLSAIQVALIYLTEMNFDLAELRWCLLKAGSKPDPTEVQGPEGLEGVGSGVR